MGLMLDTCIFIEAEKTQNAIDFDQWELYGDACMSVITVSELLMGVYLADTKARKIKRSAFVEAIIHHVPVIDFTIEVARLHAELYAFLASKGKLIGAHDMLIAATALAHGHAILTANHREFTRVPGLKVVHYLKKERVKI